MRTAARGLVIALAASPAGLARASGSPVTDEVAWVAVAWLALCALIVVASLVMALRRGRQRGARAGWRFFGGALVTLSVSAFATTWLVEAPFANALPPPWGLGLVVLLPTLLIWLAFVLAIRLDDGREENRAWKATR
ncbi:MAG TPA: hypothetical protein VFQ84_02235 [Arenimonas sp.]|uniref:hypothetical protein n=1 Tax=Arenimonas sp. TaxID=1872635 RepID=UPI002D7F6122|nr:hypothetical protein [Arenimonas sp.]HEU0152144.1 hypothetical protein [Arenimonas sp.]